MNRAKAGPIVIAAILVGVVLIFLANRETEVVMPTRAAGIAQSATPDDPKPTARTGPVREFPIGEEVTRNKIQVAAVWLPSVGMQGMPDPSDDVIHVEADVKATADNPNGFAKDEFVPYLKIRYDILDAKTGKSVGSGDLTPMVASDGLHYGANIPKPAPGSYRLVYKIEPPSAGGLGRHSDKATGVAPWWEPFDATFDWTVEPLSTKG